MENSRDEEKGQEREEGFAFRSGLGRTIDKLEGDWEGKKRVRKAENGRGDDDTFTRAMFCSCERVTHLHGKRGVLASFRTWSMRYQYGVNKRQLLLVLRSSYVHENKIRMRRMCWI
uniref:Uncharacterized protein n=1 Tax=Pristionchus pacificus TaxID=54126 RepID=A0A2A6CUQ5_PRIPA|eukprot:PDM81889.1 hypothetical protein PRIPAC_34043 [Pristionchus pacificus]